MCFLQGTAAAYFKRFYLHTSIMEHHPKDILYVITVFSLCLALKTFAFLFTVQAFSQRVWKIAGHCVLRIIPELCYASEWRWQKAELTNTYYFWSWLGQRVVVYFYWFSPILQTDFTLSTFCPFICLAKPKWLSNLTCQSYYLAITAKL